MEKYENTEKVIYFLGLIKFFVFINYNIICHFNLPIIYVSCLDKN